jgi:prephenate dehydratase
MEPLPCPTFEDAFAALRAGEAALGMIAVENSTYGRVADVHQLIPDSGSPSWTRLRARAHRLLASGARWRTSGACAA